jgi:TPR repeat protein
MFIRSRFGRPCALFLVAAIFGWQPAAALTFDPENLWPRGSTLKVCFFNGSAVERKMVASTASEWSKFGSIKFDFGGDGGKNCTAAQDFEVRVLVTDRESWTYPGIRATTNVPRDKPTMSLGLRNQAGIETQRIVLHEFGHALGFLHEEVNPVLNCATEVDWANLVRTLGFDRETAQKNLFGAGGADSRPTATNVGGPSVMTLGLEPNFFLRGSASPCFMTQSFDGLSELDKAGIGKVYPFKGPALQARMATFPARTPLRTALDESIGFSGALPAAIADIRPLSAAVVALEGFNNSDAHATGTLLGLVDAAAASIVADPANAGMEAIIAYKEQRFDEACEAARRRAGTGDPSSAMLLAAMIFRSQGRAFDAADALQWLRAAADHKSRDGELILGYAYLHGLGLAQDRDLAIKYLEAARAAGQATAGHVLGALYVAGGGVERDLKRAYRYFDVSASAGFVPSRRALALMNDQGLGIEANAKKAVEYATQAANAGDDIAGMLLGVIVADGGVMPSDQGNALDRLLRSTTHDEALPNAVMGVVYDRGLLGQARDRASAIGFYSKGESLGSGLLWQRLAELDLESHPQGQASVVRYFRMAAELGQISSALKLGDFYKSGLGTAKPDEKADSSDQDAYPIARDQAKAYGWFTLAGLYANGTERERAIREVQAIGQNMNRSEWVRGTELAVAKVRQREGLLKDAAVAPAGVATRVEALRVQSTGSGVLIDGSGYVVTNAHVAKDCQRYRVTLDGALSNATLVRIGEAGGMDLAVLKTEVFPGHAAKLRTQQIGLEAVIAVGYPEPDVLQSHEAVKEPGSVTALRGVKDDTTRFQMSATINPGNSGGPVFDLSGNVAGIAVERIKTDVLAGANFAIKSEIVASFLSSFGIPFERGTVTESLTADQVFQHNRKNVAFVECLGQPSSRIAYIDAQ